MGSTENQPVAPIIRNQWALLPWRRTQRIDQNR